MARIEVHQQRLAEIDDEIQRIDHEIATLSAQRRANPTGGAAGAASAARARRQQFAEEREEVAGDISAIQALEHSKERKAQRAQARKTMEAALGTAEHRRKLAAALDQAGKVFLAALDELCKLGGATRDAVQEAAELATPFHTHLLGDPWHSGLLEQRRRLIELTTPHASAFGGPDMMQAMAFFVRKILQRMDCPQGIAEPAGGWSWDAEVLKREVLELHFEQAAQRAHERMEHQSSRIEYCLKEPHELAEIAGGKYA